MLEWFAAQRAPAFAMFGRQAGLPMASLAGLKSPAIAKAIQQLRRQLTAANRDVVCPTCSLRPVDQRKIPRRSRNAGRNRRGDAKVRRDRRSCAIQREGVVLDV